MEQRSWVERFLAVYDTPIYRDWLFWAALALSVFGSVRIIQTTGSWHLVLAPLSFAVIGWILGAPRSFIRGYREDHGEPANSAESPGPVA